MKILAVDTSTTACSVALWIEGDGRELLQISANRHSELLLPMVDRLTSAAELSLRQCDAIAVGEGPGSFTGLRIGVGVVQGLAFGADIPVVPVSSLLAQACRHPAPHSLCAFDARMGQVYWGLYGAGPDGRMEPAAEVSLAGPGDVRLSPDHQWSASGTGCDRYRADIRACNPNVQIEFIPHSFPHALDVARIAVGYYQSGKTVAAEEVAPRYVRDNVTTPNI